jgi:hypothetical protein
MGRNFSFTRRRTLASGAMLRPQLMAAVVTAALAIGGCGGDDAYSTPAKSVSAYNHAVAGGDGDKACAHLDPSAQKELQNSTQGSARGSCKQVIDLLAAFYDDATKDRLRDAKIAASEQGDRGSARFNSPTGLGGPDQAQTYDLRREGGKWKITSLGLSGSDPGTGAP